MLTYYNDDMTKGHYFGNIIMMLIELVKSFFKGYNKIFRGIIKYGKFF